MSDKIPQVPQAEPSKEEDCGCEEKVNLKAMPQVSFSEHMAHAKVSKKIGEATSAMAEIYLNYQKYMLIIMVIGVLAYFGAKYIEMSVEYRARED
jgi:hypothetical protein